MPFPACRAVLLLIALGLGACTNQHVARMEPFIPPIDDEAPQLKDAIEVGQISGGSSFLNNAGVTDGEMKDVLGYALQSARVLAPSPAAAHWRLDVTLDFHPAPRWAFADQQVDTNITYHLISLPGGEQAFERLVRTSDIKQAPEAGVQVLQFLFTGLNGISADADTRRKYAYEQTVRSNLVAFFDALGDWARAAPPAVAVLPSAAPSPPTQIPAARAGPPPAVGAVSSPAGQAAAEPAPPPPPVKQVAVVPPQAETPAQEPALFGDKAPFRCPAPETEIDFQSGAKRVFSPAADAGPVDCPYASPSGVAKATMFGFYTRTAETALRDLWPLRVGKKVSFITVGDAQIHFVESYHVVRHDRVAVPAGTFDAFVVDWDCSSNNRYANGYHETATYWYAPTVGYVVKVEHHLKGGLYARLSDDEAVRVTSLAKE